MTAQDARSRRSGERAEQTRTFDRSGNIADVPVPRLGPQTMVRQMSGERISGRPDPEEQKHLAAGIGATLRALRREHGLSVRDLERRSGVSRATISRLERGLRRPRASTIGWLAWGLVGADHAAGVKTGLCAAAGDSLVAESRWSERTHARRAWQRLQMGSLEPPGWMVAPYCVIMLGDVMPDRLEELRNAQESARAGDVPWPEHTTLEALHLGNELDSATWSELRTVGRGMVAEDRAAQARAARKKRRELRAQLGLTGTDTRRPIRVPRGLPPEEREIFQRLAVLEQATSAAARFR
jgi:DNA-binding XRE family transcriptional regulator